MFLSYHIYECYIPKYMKASPVVQRLKCLPAMWETWVPSLGWKDPLEKEMAAPLFTPVFLPRESHGRRNLVGYSPWVAKGWTQLSDFTFTFVHFRDYRAHTTI